MTGKGIELAGEGMSGNGMTFSSVNLKTGLQMNSKGYMKGYGLSLAGAGIWDSTENVGDRLNQAEDVVNRDVNKSVRKVEKKAARRPKHREEFKMEKSKPILPGEKLKKKLTKMSKNKKYKKLFKQLKSRSKS